MHPDQSSTADSDGLPRGGLPISVICNTNDRCAQLRTLLHALRRQTYDDFEVVVVLGPAPDGSREMIRGELDDRVHVVACPEFNLSVSRNLGLRHAAGEVVAFIDDDSVPSLTWLAQLAAVYLADPDVAGVGGRTYQIHPSIGDVQFLRGRVSVLGDQDDVRWDERAPAPPSSPPEAWFPRFHGTNMSYRRRVLLELHGFDERFEYLFDDADIAVRLGLAGHRLEALSQAVVYHAAAQRRNQQEFLAQLNWYCLLRSLIYFTLKNGSRLFGWSRSFSKALQHISYFYWVVNDLRGQGILRPEAESRARRQLRRAWLEGIWQGTAGRRRIPTRIDAVERPHLPYRRGGEPPIAAVPPIGLAKDDTVPTLSQPPLRICLLSAGYPPTSTEGVARSTHILARGLAELGHEVHVITAAQRHRVVVDDGVFIREVRPSADLRYHALRDFPSLADWLRYSHAAWEEVESLRLNHRIQIVDSPLWNLDGLVTAVAGRVPVAVRVVTAMKQIAETFHTARTDEHRLMAELEEELLGLAGLVISNSDATARTLEEVYAFDTASPRHTVVPYGIVPVAEEALQPATAGDGDPTVLFVGRLESRKGILDLFAAIPEVLAEHPRTRFLIAGGDNSAHDGFQTAHGMDYPTWFHRRFPRCRERVEFLGFVDEGRLHELYRDCDVFVAPSHYESFGLIYLEAMAYARPAVGCRAGGPQEIIVDGETGFLVPPRDAPALAAALARLLADERLRRDMGQAGRRRLLASFTHTRMAEGFADAYRRTLGLASA